MSTRRIRPPLPARTATPSPTVAAAQALASEALARLDTAPAFRQLDPVAQRALLRDLSVIRETLSQQPSSLTPGARALDTVASLRSRLGGDNRAAGARGNESPAAEPAAPAASKPAATETLAQRAGALSDEIDFPAFVAGLVHGTFDAIVNSAIRQMESFAELVSVVARDADQFTRDHVSDDQAKDWLLQHYPREFHVAEDEEARRPTLRVRPRGPDDEPLSPAWLADFDLEGQELTDELLTGELIPATRRRLGNNRLQTLATLVLLGLNRIVVRDGSITARVRFRAAARDVAAVDYGASQDPSGSSSWGTRGSSAYVGHDTKISTVGVNVQAESELKAELFGEVRINFASETLPLDRFVDQARMALLQNHARPVTNLLVQAPALPAPPPQVATPPASSPAPALAPAPPPATPPPS